MDLCISLQPAVIKPASSNSLVLLKVRCVASGSHAGSAGGHERGRGISAKGRKLARGVVLATEFISISLRRPSSLDV